MEALDQGDCRAARTAQAVLTMTLSLDLSVIAEGIETPEQQRALIDMNGKQGQGFLLGRPVSWTDFDH